MKFRVCVLLFCISGLSGCAHYYLPATQLETPEARGTLGSGRVEFLTVQTGTNLSAEPGRLVSDVKAGKDSGLVLPVAPPRYAFGFSLGVSERVDVGVRFEPFSPLLLRGKYQFFGSPEKVAVKGNFSSSLAASAGVMLAARSQYLSGALGVPGGYRFATNHLVSLTPFFSYASISGVTLPAAGGGDALSASQFGVTLGYQYTILGLITRVEAVRSWGKTSDVSVGGVFGGLLVGIAF